MQLLLCEWCIRTMGPNPQLSHCAIEIICRYPRWLTGHNKWSAFAWLLAWLLGSILLHSILIALAMLKHSEVKAGYYRSLKDVTHVALLPHCMAQVPYYFFYFKMVACSVYSVLGCKVCLEVAYVCWYSSRRFHCKDSADNPLLADRVIMAMFAIMNFWAGCLLVS